MKNLRIGFLFCASLLLVGCSPYTSSMRYEPAAEPVTGGPTVSQPVAIGTFSDNRGTDERWLGAVRNGYGMPVKKLYTDKPTSEEVRAVFIGALAARGIQQSDSHERLVIEGSLLKFDCSAIFDYEAHAILQVSIVSLPSRQVVFTQMYRTDNTMNGFGGALYGGYKDQALLAQKTLNQTIDKFFADPLSIAALNSPPTRSEATVADRLRSLDDLKSRGLISESEYESKRKELLRDL